MVRESTENDFSEEDSEAATETPAAYPDASPIVIGLSIALFIFGVLTNVRKSYHIASIRRKSLKPFGQPSRPTKVELHAITLFACNVISLTSRMFFSLLEIFPSATVCFWRICADAVFQFATPTFVLLLATARRPREEAFGSKWKVSIMYAVVLAWISAATAPYALLNDIELAKAEATDTSNAANVEAKTHSGDHSIDITQADTVTKCSSQMEDRLYCSFQPSKPSVAYIVFGYSALFGYLLPTFVLVLKLCVFNTTQQFLTAAHTDEYKRYVISVTVIWILCWTPYWITETFRFFLSLRHPGLTDAIPVVVQYILHILPTQIASVCFPLTCPEVLSERRAREWRPPNDAMLEISRDDHSAIGINAVHSEASAVLPHGCFRWFRKKQPSPLAHPVSTLWNITLSLTFPLIHHRRPSGLQKADFETVHVSFVDRNGEGEEETFL